MKPILPHSLLLLPVLAWLAGCSFRVPSRAEDLAPAADLARATSPDLRAALDLQPAPDLRSAAPDLAPPDLSRPWDMSGPCFGRTGTRACLADGGQAGVCDDRLVLTADRACTGDGCATGYCRKPASAVQCKSDAWCAALPGTSCQLFTNIFNLSIWYCAPPPGSGAAGAACAQDRDCASNLCRAFAGDAPRCARPCGGDADCGGLGTCQPIYLMVEGQRVGMYLCAP